MKHIIITTIATVLVAGCTTGKQKTVQALDIDIWQAARKGNIIAVEYHLAAGTDVNAKSEGGWTPLQTAAHWGHKEIVELLIVKGADVNAKDDIDYTPLDEADGKTETAELLRKHGGKHGTIHSAVDGGDAEAVKEFLAAAVDVNAKSDSGWTPLHRAAYNGHKEIVELLIAEGADVNAKNEGGWTPLCYAVDKGHKEVVELLIVKGADVSVIFDAFPKPHHLITFPLRMRRLGVALPR